MSKCSDKKQKLPRAIFLTIEDIEFWLSVGCVHPSLETLTEVVRNARKILAKKGKVIIRWEADGTFLITHPTNPEAKKIINPHQKSNVENN